MACTGCKLTAKFTKDPSYQGQNPILDPCEFDPQPGDSPDGSCGGTPCAQTAPCYPIGGILLTSCYVNHMNLSFLNVADGGVWEVAELRAGHSYIILVYNTAIPCGEDMLFAELFETDGTTPLGKIHLVCSKCEQT